MNGRNCSSNYGTNNYQGPRGYQDPGRTFQKDSRLFNPYQSGVGATRCQPQGRNYNNFQRNENYQSKKSNQGYQRFANVPQTRNEPLNSNATPFEGGTTSRNVTNSPSTSQPRQVMQILRKSSDSTNCMPKTVKDFENLIRTMTTQPRSD